MYLVILTGRTEFGAASDPAAKQSQTETSAAGKYMYIQT